MVRSGFSILLNAQPDIEVVGEAVNGQGAIARVAELRPDVILMDVGMPVLDGLRATRQITAGDGAPRATPVVAAFGLAALTPATAVAAGTAVAGALLSLLRERSGSLAAPVLHLAANCVAPLASALARTFRA